MLNSKQTLENFAGISGDGALCILGLFMLLDSQAPNVLPTIEFYAKTATWGVVAAVPVLAIAYVMGLLSISAANALSDRIFGARAQDDLLTIGIAATP